MGEKTRNVGVLKIKNTNYEVEMNEPVSENRGAIIHIQNENARLDMTQREFYEIGACIMLAKRQLVKIKEKK